MKTGIWIRYELKLVYCHSFEIKWFKFEEKYAYHFIANQDHAIINHLTTDYDIANELLNQITHAVIQKESIIEIVKNEKKYEVVSYLNITA